MAALHVNMFGRGRSLQVAITMACTMAFILFGYDQGVFGNIVTNPDWLRTFHHPGNGLEGIIVSVYNLGAFSGCIVNFFIAEKLGRRKCMWFAMIWIIVGAALQCSSYSVAQLIVARYITGIGTGIETSTVPMYQSELCDANKRGRLVSSEVWFIGFGIVIAYFFDYGMSYVGGSIAWRLPIACQILITFFVLVIVLGCPESPRWLFYHGRSDEARQALSDVWDVSIEDEKVLAQEREILEVIALEKERGQYKWSQLLKKDEVQTGRRVLLAWGMQFMNQIGGINLIVYYMPTALEQNVGLSHNTASLLSGAINCMFCVGALVPTFFLDRLGRRGPMMWGSAGLGICMMLVAVLLSFQDRGGALSKATSEASVAFFFLYMIIYSATAACVPWAYVPEILPLHARAKGTAIGISSNWIWNFFIVMITPTLIDKLRWKAYLIFMCTNLAFVPLVYFFYPETTNLTLEEVDFLFIEGGRANSVVSVANASAQDRAQDVEKVIERRSSLKTSVAEQLEVKAKY